MAVAFLTNDPVQTEQYEEVETYTDWAAVHGWDGRDTGIDLIAKLRNEDGYAAIQCKFYAPDHRIQKRDIDSFISASGKAPFRRRVIMDTTDLPWSDNAETMLRGQSIPTLRIGLADLQESPIRWDAFAARGEVVLRTKKMLRPHQQDALDAVRVGLQEADRGKLIMACGTGKTFISLKIAEDLVGPGGCVLFLVPSLALMAQTIREWSADAGLPLRAFSVCSDTQVGKRRRCGDDVAEIDILDLAFPATTDPARLAEGARTPAPGKMTVVFATYQSIQVIADAQQKHGLAPFTLIICDEAHRTTGVTLADEDESNFVKVHSNANIQGGKRLYMTATPRIYSDTAKARAEDEGAESFSMDKEEDFGKTLFYRGFSWAVENALLTDYKVIVLAMDESLISTAVQRRLNDGDNELLLDDATKIVGCYKALTKSDIKADVAADPNPMRRALAFCRDIRSSKLIQSEFTAVVDEFLGLDTDGEEDDDANGHLHCEIQHVDGTFNAKTRGRLLDWLKEDAGDDICRILTNARCLSEGVDVPALDAIMFLHPRKSQIDVVQSVGRVMRRAEGKRMGYVILPVGVPAGVEPEQALKDNERYRVVWQILNALRAHDDRFDATINQASLGQDVSDHIEIVGITGPGSPELDAITATVDELPLRVRAEASGLGLGHGGDGEREDMGGPTQIEMTYAVDEFSRAIMARIVKRCGTRDYWEDWATNIAQIAKNHITRLTGILATPNTEARAAFDSFLEELQDDLNDSLTEADAIEMLAQHIITRPVFQVLFEGHQFTQENPVSRAMQRVLDVLDEANLDKESRDLEKFYASVQTRARGITDPKAKQNLVVELYDKFFRRAFPRTTEKLGIVYTPVAIVDFIIRSVDEVLREQFGQTLGSRGIHIMDPFTGTGSFVTRLLQSGLIAPEEMAQKYRHEIHANEIVLLAYYIAAVNIEAVYHGLMGEGDYVPFEGICLTDTFQMYEADDLVAHFMPDNSERRKRQKATDIRVIMGNPPYAVAKGVTYPTLDRRIAETYAARSSATNKNALYDSYIRAIRWASDRLGDSGVLAFVTNGGWVDANTADGLRQCLVEDFSTLYVFHLRGNQRTSGERSRREGGKVFGGGSRAPVAISVFVKNPEATHHGRILFRDIGDYLNREDKLRTIQAFGSIGGITRAGGWIPITPDDHGDWLKQRDAGFQGFLSIGTKRASDEPVLFDTFSNGLKTNMDAWSYNSSRVDVRKNMENLCSVYNDEITKFRKSNCNTKIEYFTLKDPTKISWHSALYAKGKNGTMANIYDENFVVSMYRPFSKQIAYFDRMFNQRVSQLPRLFPAPEVENRVMQMTGPGEDRPFSILMADVLPDLHVIHGGQCFPLRVYDAPEDQTRGVDLFTAARGIGAYQARHGITDAGLAHFQAAYPGEAITKEDIFYYVYGLLHSRDYRDRYADNLTKELPRIPCVKTAADFWTFSRAGRALGDLHVGYETVEPWPITYKQGDPRTWVVQDPEAFYRVTKMTFGGKGRQKDKSTVVYNANITMQTIPLEAYDYIVNGKPALEWVMERQSVKTDKASGIVNDANRYAIETMADPAYPLTLFQRVITVSMRTLEIVKGLPDLDIKD
nr:type ISP restriction/modification enzyme [Roseospira visakhapatnamensis]